MNTATTNLQSAIAEQLKLDKQVAAIRKELAEAETAADAARRQRRPWQEAGVAS